MKLLPRTRDDWAAVVLLPFKVYAVAAFPLFAILRSFASVRIDGRSSDMHVFMGVYTGYLLCIPILLGGAAAQASGCRRRAAAGTLAFAGCAILFLVLLLRR
jgi:peptidoglycan/LPS O-acetylase OafA/YrhL